MDDTITTDRRSVLRGAVAAGALLWTAPAVQVIAPPAHAAGSAAPSLSYVGLLLQQGTTYHRVKYEFSGDEGTRLTYVAESGPGWNAGKCEDLRAAFYRGGAGLPAGSLSNASPVPAGVVAQAAYTSAGFSFVLPVGVRLRDWLVHNGNCCTLQGGADTLDADYATCQPAATNGAYKVQFVDVLTGPSGGNQWLFPTAPNDSTCTRIGGDVYRSSCTTPPRQPQR